MQKHLLLLFSSGFGLVKGKSYTDLVRKMHTNSQPNNSYGFFWALESLNVALPTHASFWKSTYFTSPFETGFSTSGHWLFLQLSFWHHISLLPAQI